MLIAFRFWERFILWVAIEFTDFSFCSKIYVRLKNSDLNHSSHQLIANLDLIPLFFFCAFYFLFIYLGSNRNRLSNGRVYIQRCVQSQWWYWITQSMNLNYPMRSGPYGFATLDHEKNGMKKNCDTIDLFLYISIYTLKFLWWNITLMQGRGISFGTGITFQNH